MKFTLKTISFLFTVMVTFSCTSPNKKEEKKATEEKVEVVKEVKKETIVTIASTNENFSTLTAAVTAADLVATLNSDGPFTVFAPVNSAFDKLPEGTLSSLLEAENKETLSAILTYHVVSGKFLAADVIKAINDNEGKFVIKTVQGNNITASLNEGNVILTDEKGGTSTVIITDVDASTGVIYTLLTA